MDAFSDARWEEVAKSGTPGRSREECAKEWARALRPSSQRGPWTEQEDRRLLQLCRRHGLHAVRCTHSCDRSADHALSRIAHCECAPQRHARDVPQECLASMRPARLLASMGACMSCRHKCMPCACRGMVSVRASSQYWDRRWCVSCRAVGEGGTGAGHGAHAGDVPVALPDTPQCAAAGRQVRACSHKSCTECIHRTGRSRTCLQCPCRMPRAHEPCRSIMARRAWKPVHSVIWTDSGDAQCDGIC